MVKSEKIVEDKRKKIISAQIEQCIGNIILLKKEILLAQQVDNHWWMKKNILLVKEL